MAKAPKGPRPELIVYLLLVIITLAAYGGISGYNFVSYDDIDYIVENNHVQEGISFKSITWAFKSTDISYWHPLTWLSHMLDVEFFDLRPGPHHLTSLFLHLASTLLLFTALKTMTGAIWRSAIVAGLFALHPLNVESVAWLSERKNVLSTFFWMLTLLAYAHYAKHPGFKRYFLLFTAFALGLMSKPMLVTLPFVLLLIDYWPLGRSKLIRPAGDDDAGSYSPTSVYFQETTIFKIILEKVPLFALSAISIYMSSLSVQRGKIVIPVDVVPTTLRLGNALVSYASYIGKMIWPHHLAIFYPYPVSLPLWKTAGAGLLLIGITIFTLWKVRQRPYLAVGWLWFMGTLVPVIGFVQVGMWPAMADRFAYVPLIGLFVLTTWGVADLLAQWRHKRLVLAIAAGVVFAALMVCTWFQLQHWKNDVSLYSHALRVTHNNGLAHYGLAEALDQQGQLDQAIIHYSKTLQIYPNYARAHNSLGTAFARQGNIQQAIYHYHQVLRIDPESSGAYANLGKVFMNQGKTEDAIYNYQAALRIKPDIIMALYNLSWIFATHENGNFRDGKKAYGLAKKLCELTGDNQSFALDVLAAAQAENGRYDEAVATARKGLEFALRYGPEELVEGLTKRLALYQTGRPYRKMRKITNEPKNND